MRLPNVNMMANVAVSPLKKAIKEANEINHPILKL
jgi:hypothetical protein